MSIEIKIPANSDRKGQYEEPSTLYEESKKASVFGFSYETNPVEIVEEVLETELPTELVEKFDEKLGHYNKQSVAETRDLGSVNIFKMDLNEVAVARPGFDADKESSKLLNHPRFDNHLGYAVKAAQKRHAKGTYDHDLFKKGLQTTVGFYDKYNAEEKRQLASRVGDSLAKKHGFIKEEVELVEAKAHPTLHKVVWMSNSANKQELFASSEAAKKKCEALKSSGTYHSVKHIPPGSTNESVELEEGKNDWIKDTFKEFEAAKPAVKFAKGEHEDSVRLKPNEGIKQKADAHTSATKAARTVKGKGYGVKDVSDDEENTQQTQPVTHAKQFDASSALMKAFGMNNTEIPRAARSVTKKVVGRDTVDKEESGQVAPKPAQNHQVGKVADPSDLAVKIHAQLHGATRAVLGLDHIRAALARGMQGSAIIGMSRSAIGRKQLRGLKEELELSESVPDGKAAAQRVNARLAAIDRESDARAKGEYHNGDYIYDRGTHFTVRWSGQGHSKKKYESKDAAKAAIDKARNSSVDTSRLGVYHEEVELDEAAYRSTFQHPVHGTVTIKKGETKDSATARMDAAKAAKSAKAKTVASFRAPKELSDHETGDVDKAQKNSAHSGLGGRFDHHIADPKHTTIEVNGKKAAAAHCHGRFAYKVEDDLGLDQDTDEAHHFTMYRHPDTKKMHVIYGHAKSVNDGSNKKLSYDDFVKGRNESVEDSDDMLVEYYVVKGDDGSRKTLLHSTKFSGSAAAEARKHAESGKYKSVEVHKMDYKGSVKHVVVNSGDYVKGKVASLDESVSDEHYAAALKVKRVNNAITQTSQKMGVHPLEALKNLDRKAKLDGWKDFHEHHMAMNEEAVMDWDIEIIKEGNMHKYQIIDGEDILAEGVNLSYEGALKAAVRKSDQLIKHIEESVAKLKEEKEYNDGQIGRVKNIVKTLVNK